MKQSRFLLALLVTVSFSACSLVGMSSVEEPKYQVVLAAEQFELRRYEPQVLVQTVVDGDYEEAQDEAFRRLFRYISGRNDKALEISMTAPVEVSESVDSLPEQLPFENEKTESGWKMSFVLPDQFTVATTPKPTDERVVLQQREARTVAVLRYSGRWSYESQKAHAAKLSEWLTGQGLKPVSPMRAAAYDPPWTLPFLRRNEVLVDVQPRDS